MHLCSNVDFRRFKVGRMWQKVSTRVTCEMTKLAQGLQGQTRQFESDAHSVFQPQSLRISLQQLNVYFFTPYIFSDFQLGFASESSSVIQLNLFAKKVLM